nr:uncharacterized protein LOC117846943 [Setaria viridis]
MAVLRDCMSARTYPHPPAGRYYLVDSGYAVREGYLGPYRNTRYHLEKFSRREADTLEEKFNFHHSSLRNVVERAFGVLKSRWHILREVPLYSRERQTKIVIACFALHNYLLDVGNDSSAGSSRAREPDYAVSEWVAANATPDMGSVRDWIAAGISLM